MHTKRNQILNWHAKGAINDIDKALMVTQANHTHKDWYQFIRQLMLWLGALASAVGVIFFFAYNWDTLSTLSKFVLIQSAIVVSVILYIQTEKHTSSSTAVLMVMVLLIGTLFALFGQTYQTGKDPWQLFFTWMLVIMPLCYVSRSAVLWLFCLALANLTLNLILDVRYGWFGSILHRDRDVILYALLNGVFAVVFEGLYIYKRLCTRVAAQVSLIMAMISLSWMAVYSVFDLKHYVFETLFYFIWMAAIYYVYRLKKLDVLILSSWVVSGIAFIVSFIGSMIDDDLGGGTFMIFTILIIGLSTVGGQWLMGLLKTSQQPENHHEQ